MNNIWVSLEHMTPNEFTKEDYTWFLFLVRESLRKKHGDIEPEFAFLRKEETVISKKGDLRIENPVKIPRLTVCHLRPSDPSPNAGTTAVGFAFCNSNDNPNKFFGKALALKRAVKALVGREDCQENFIRHDTSFEGFLREIGLSTNVKSSLVYDPEWSITRHLKKVNAVEEGKGEGS